MRRLLFVEFYSYNCNESSTMYSLLCLHFLRLSKSPLDNKPSLFHDLLCLVPRGAALLSPSVVDECKLKQHPREEV